MLTSKELMDRSDARLESVYQSIEQGQPVDFRKLAELDLIETAQIGRAFAREAAENDKAADDKFLG